MSVELTLNTNLTKGYFLGSVAPKPAEQVDPVERAFRRLKTNFEIQRSGRALNTEVWAKMIATDLRAISATKEELFEAEAYLGDHYGLVKRLYDQETVAGKVTVFLSDSVGKSATAWSGISRLARNGTSWIKSQAEEEIKKLSSIKVNKKWEPDFSGQNKKKDWILLGGRTVAGAVVGTAGIVTLASLAAGGMYMRSLWEQPAAPTKVVKPEVPRVSPPPVEINNSVDSINNNLYLDADVLKRYGTVKGRLIAGDSLLDAVGRAWYRRFGVEPTTDQLYAATKYVAKNKHLYDVRLGIPKNVNNHRDVRNLQENEEIEFNVQGLLMPQPAHIS